MKFVLATLVFAASVSCFAVDKAADAKNVDTACAKDADTAGCATEKVGTGMLKCMHNYKKQHKDFKFSTDCKAAMAKMRKDHNTGK